jgi:hypothetical protein
MHNGGNPRTSLICVVVMQHCMNKGSQVKHFMQKKDTFAAPLPVSEELPYLCKCFSQLGLISQ